eukprot:270312-Pleurochrysis_carterae.AAC.2
MQPVTLDCQRRAPSKVSTTSRKNATMPGKVKLVLHRGVDVVDCASLWVLLCYFPPAVKIASFAPVLSVMLGLRPISTQMCLFGCDVLAKDCQKILDIYPPRTDACI